MKNNTFSILLLIILFLSSSQTSASTEQKTQETFRLSYPQTVGVIEVLDPHGRFNSPATGYLIHQYLIRTTHYHRYPPKETTLCSIVYLDMLKDKVHYGRIAQSYQCDPTMQQKYDVKDFGLILKGF